MVRVGPILSSGDRNLLNEKNKLEKKKMWRLFWTREFEWLDCMGRCDDMYLLTET